MLRSMKRSALNAGMMTDTSGVPFAGFAGDLDRRGLLIIRRLDWIVALRAFRAVR